MLSSPFRFAHKPITSLCTSPSGISGLRRAGDLHNAGYPPVRVAASLGGSEQCFARCPSVPMSPCALGVVSSLSLFGYQGALAGLRRAAQPFIFAACVRRWIRLSPAFARAVRNESLRNREFGHPVPFPLSPLRFLALLARGRRCSLRLLPLFSEQHFRYMLAHTLLLDHPHTLHRAIHLDGHSQPVHLLSGRRLSTCTFPLP